MDTHYSWNRGAFSELSLCVLGWRSEEELSLQSPRCSLLYTTFGRGALGGAGVEYIHPLILLARQCEPRVRPLGNGNRGWSGVKGGGAMWLERGSEREGNKKRAICHYTLAFGFGFGHGGCRWTVSQMNPRRNKTALLRTHTGVCAMQRLYAIARSNVGFELFLSRSLVRRS